MGGYLLYMVWYRETESFLKSYRKRDGGLTYSKVDYSPMCVELLVVVNLLKSQETFQKVSEY